MKARNVAAILSLAYLLAVTIAGASLAGGKSPKRDCFLQPAKVDEPIKPGESVSGSADAEPVKNLVQHDEPIKVGVEKTEGVNEERDLMVAKEISVRATGYYSPEPGQKKYLHGTYGHEKKVNGSGKITAMGTVPQKGRTLSADPKILPLGTKVKIKGYPGVFVVEDTGSSVKGRRIDIYTGKGDQGREEAVQLGSRKLIVQVLRLPKDG